MPKIIASPLMSGTRIFLTVLLAVCYVGATLMAVASLALPFILTRPPAEGSLTGADAVMIISLLIYLAAAIAFFRLLRAIVTSVDQGDPFSLTNARRLEWMGWIWLVFWCVGLAFSFYDAMPTGFGGGIEFTGEWLADLISDGIDLVIPLTLFILARVFRSGTAMRDDLEGTV